MIRLEFNFAVVAGLIRRQKGLRQNELGVDTTTVSQMELGNTRPKIETMETIAHALGTTVEEINATADYLNGLSGRNLGDSNSVSPHSRLHQILDDVLSSNRKGVEPMKNGVFSHLMVVAANIYSRPFDYKLWEELFPKRK